MASKVYLVFFLLLIALSGWSQQAFNQFRRIDKENGLSHNQINNIFSDSRGFMWFATIAGLNRFDGNSFKVFKNQPGNPASIPEYGVIRVDEDHLGLLWLTTRSGIFFYNWKDDSFSYDHPLFHLNLPLARNNITSLLVDSDSCLWIGNSELGLYHYDKASGHLQLLTHAPGNESTISSNRITGLAMAPDGHLYAINNSGVVDVIDIRKQKVVERINMGVDRGPGLYAGYELFVDVEGDLWLYSNSQAGDLCFLDRETGRRQIYGTHEGACRLSSNIITGVLQDNAGKIWVSTDHGGVNVIDKGTQSVMLLENVPGDNRSLSGNSVTSMFKSKDGIIWVGTYKNGINYYHERLFQFPLFRNNPFVGGYFPYDDVNCFAEDDLGNLWVGTNGSGLIYFDRRGNGYRTFLHNPLDPNSLSNNVVVSLCLDSRQRLWIGTYHGGLNCLDGTRFRHYRHDPANPVTLRDDDIWQIIEDQEKRLWIGTLGGGLELFDEQSDGFIHHLAGDYNSINSNYIMALTADRTGNLWVGTPNGLNVFDTRTRRFMQFVSDAQTPGSLSHNNVLSVMEDERGRVWVGTRDGLNLYDREQQSFRVFRVEDGLPDNNILSLQEDEKGHLWMATLNGISQLITTTSPEGYTFRNYDLLDGLQGLEYNERASFKTARGELIFGGAGGFNLFKPSLIVEQEGHYRVELTDLKLFNKSIGIGEVIDHHIILNGALTFTRSVAFNHDQNVFSLEFSALNFFHPERTRYRYMLEGFNEAWIETDTRNRIATFTNLNPGRYVFRVKASGTDGSWAGPETRLSIDIIPPFYATPLAYGLYLVVFGLLVILLVLTIRRRERMKYFRSQEQLEHMRIRDLDAMKIKFFTNVSHEFRTPLTLIITPLEKLIGEVRDEGIRKQMLMIQRNARRLLNLVNQLLDFRKLEVSSISLNTEFGDIGTFLQDAFNSFVDLFESKNIDYQYHSNIRQYFVNFDQDKVEKIVFNLLSNAVKFTHENGKIEFKVMRHHDRLTGFADHFSGHEYLEIQVQDNGIGIPFDKQNKIFERFYQSDTDPQVSNQGSGIGLSLTQEFVRLHGGTVHVESQPGKGSLFVVRLPLSPEKGVHTGVHMEMADRLDKGSSEENESRDNEKPIVLIIDDNEDLRTYLKDNLKHNYVILEASNGREGWHIILTKMPHLVVSDIMMPVLNGIELCKRIKSDTRTSHVPVILLTARSSNEQKLEGLGAGAEDYITKPFSYEILEMKIKQLIRLRSTFQQAFIKKFDVEPGEIGITSLDEKFLAKALKTVEQNIGNSAFSVEKMGRELGVSRGHLYNKLMALTGKTPIEFIRVMRLKRAAQLLSKSQQTVSEIAFQVGFNDTKYFTKYFKDEFGVAPSDYSKSHK